MRLAADKNKNDTQAPAAKRRKYSSPAREQQSAETRESIIVAGSELVHQFTAWDWTNLTAKVVGERAELSERTVRRYFSSESKLRDAILERLVEESGVTLNHLELDNFASNVALMFRYLQSFAVEKTTTQDPTFEALDKTRMKALKIAVARATPNWSGEQQETVSAVLDILWQPELYERLTDSWGFDTDRAVSTITWLIDLIKLAVQQNHVPKATS
jgi:AcrR family transcriptional regulator